MKALKQSDILDMPLLVLGLVILIWQSTVSSVAGDDSNVTICTLSIISVEFFDQDIQSKRYTMRTVRSSERFQKSTDQWSRSIGGDIGLNAVSLGMNVEFSEMTSDELKKTNYQSKKEENAIHYSPDSRQLIREITKTIEVQKILGTDTLKASASVSEEKHYGSIPKVDCPDTDENSLFNRAVNYVNTTYRNKGGTIDRNTYSEKKCFSSGICLYKIYETY